LGIHDLQVYRFAVRRVGRSPACEKAIAVAWVFDSTDGWRLHLFYQKRYVWWGCPIGGGGCRRRWSRYGEDRDRQNKDDRVPEFPL